MHRTQGRWIVGGAMMGMVFSAILGQAGHAYAANECVPGKTGKIAFMLKQQTAFRYLNADVPFFTKTAEAAGFQVVMQSAENDAQAQVAQAENVLTRRALPRWRAKPACRWPPMTI